MTDSLINVYLSRDYVESGNIFVRIVVHLAVAIVDCVKYMCRLSV